MFIINKLFERKYRENILYSARTKILVCRELQNINIYSINSLFNNLVYKNIIYIEYTFYTNRIQNINNKDNIIDYTNYSWIDSNKNQTRNSIDTKNIWIFYKSDISHNIKINSISIDFYRIIAIENLDQRNNIIIYKKLNCIQFVFSRIILTIIAIKNILYKRILKKLKDFVVQL